MPMIGCHCEVCTSHDPRDRRLRTSLHVEVGSTSIIIDIGPDFRQQVLAHQIRDIDAILITHHHADHTSGIDEIRGYNFTHRKSVPFYAEEYVCTDLQERFGYIFGGGEYPSLPQISLNKISAGKKFNVREVDIEPLRVMHGSLPVLGFRLGSFAYITDANSIPFESIQRLTGLDYLIINALRQKSHHAHFSLEESLQMISNLKPRQTYLTHISHQMGKHADVSKLLPEGVELAFDGLVFFSP